MTRLASPQVDSSIDKTSYSGFTPYQRRTRTLSLYSVTSERSSTSSLNFNVIPEVTPFVKVQRNHDARGSFVPSTSAAASLLHVVSFPLEVSNRSEKAPRRVGYESPAPSYGRPISVTPTVSSLLSKPCSSGTSSSASSIHKKQGSELHPVLARLERGSKLCAQKTGCATCQKTGRDFPQCGKCKKMWCSRECRLVGGKRHVCS